MAAHGGQSDEVNQALNAGQPPATPVTCVITAFPLGLVAGRFLSPAADNVFWYEIHNEMPICR